jgi:hypothetical protein
MAQMPKDAAELFDNLVPEGLKQYPDKARELNAIYCFKVAGDGGGEWTVDTTIDPPSCTRGDSGKAQCTIAVAQDDAVGSQRRHAALLPGQAARLGRPDAGDEAPAAVRDRPPEVSFL